MSVRKIKRLDQLAAAVQALRQDGKSVALCHGVFDLLHIGHLRHFNEARQLADVLVVTLTGDSFVNKGPGRPVFSESMRAEMIAALDNVDLVAVIPDPSALPAISAVKPTVYVKGGEYEDDSKDVTGKIILEREAVEAHGGRIHFTRGIIFSSSSLLNQFFGALDPELKEFLDLNRGDLSERRLFGLIEQCANLKVLLVGDAIIDEYTYVGPLGKPSKEHIISTLYKNTEVFAGGVFAAANHLATFCKDVEIVCTLGEGDQYEQYIRESLKANVRLTPIYLPGRPTTRKRRFVDPGYLRKLFEVYYMDDTPLEPDTRRNVNNLIQQRASNADLVIAADFGHGLINGHAIDVMTSCSRFLAVNAQTNSGNQGFNLVTRYPKADFICVDAPEIRLALGEQWRPIPVILKDVFPTKIDCTKVVVTHGARGCFSLDPDGKVHQIPAFTKTVVDTVGAGDAFFVVASALIASGASVLEAAFIGNAAGAIKVGIPGHRRSVEKVAVKKYITTLLK